MSTMPIAGATVHPTEGLSHMLTLVESHLKLHRLDAETLFRAAYMHAFQREPVLTCIREDVTIFNSPQGIVPNYVIKFMLFCYGTK